MSYRKICAPRSRAELTFDLEMMERAMEMELEIESQMGFPMLGDASVSISEEEDDPIDAAFIDSLNKACAETVRKANRSQSVARSDENAEASVEDSSPSGDLSSPSGDPSSASDRESYARRREALRRDLDPWGPFEEEIVARIVRLHLEIEGVIDYRQTLVGGGNLLPEDKRLALICRHEAHLVRMESKWLQELRNLRRDRANAEKNKARSNPNNVAAKPAKTEKVEKRSSKRSARKQSEVEREIDLRSTFVSESLIVAAAPSIVTSDGSKVSEEHTSGFAEPLTVASAPSIVSFEQVTQTGESKIEKIDRIELESVGNVSTSAETTESTRESNDEATIDESSSASESIVTVDCESDSDAVANRDVASTDLKSEELGSKRIEALETPSSGEVGEVFVGSASKPEESKRERKPATARHVSKSSRRARRRERERAKKYYPAVPLDRWYSTPEFILSGEAPKWPGKPETISVAERADALGVAIW